MLVRVLMIVQRPQRRGAEVFAFQLSRALRSAGHTIQSTYLYPYRSDGGLPLQPGDSNLEGWDAHPFEKAPGIHPLLLRNLLHVLDEFQPDIVQANGASTVKYGAFARMLRPNRSWTLIYRNIGNPQDWVRGPLRRLFYRRLVMPQLDGVVGVSRGTLNAVKDFYRLTVPLEYIPNGIEIPAQVKIDRAVVRDSLETPGNAPVILFVGSLSAEKRVDRLLRVTQQVSERIPNLHVWIIGDGPQRRQLETQMSVARFASTIQFLGIQNDVMSYMAAADLFLLTSDTEGIPAVILEAGAKGLPVVATRVGGISECVHDGKTGLLVAPEDEKGLADAVAKLLADDLLRNRMGETAQTCVREHFAMDRIANLYLDFYRKVAN